MNIKNGEATLDGMLQTHERAKGVMALLQNFVHELPDLSVVYNGEDNAKINVGWEERRRLDDLISTKQCKQHQFIDMEF